jgi:branched-chain amino acid transport system substrate-binding protein
LLNDIIPKAGSLEADKLREAALSLDIAEGGTVLGWGVKFNPETGQNDRAFATVMQWQENKVETVFPEKFATKESIMVPLPSWSSR